MILRFGTERTEVCPYANASRFCLIASSNGNRADLLSLRDSSADSSTYSFQEISQVACSASELYNPGHRVSSLVLASPLDLEAIYMNEPEIRNIASDETALPARPGGNSERSMGVVERRGVDRLFLEYYGLNEQPFGVTPDLRFLYLGAKHRQALDVLNYGTELNRGFLTLIAKPGMGKTSLLFHYLEGLRDKARTAFLFQTDGDSTELMRYLLADLGLDGKGMDLPEMRAVLSQVLMGEMEAGRRFVLVIDEAQNLDEKVLESIRLLSNFETPWMKLMQIVLAGQPQLDERLAKPSMAQLRQRVSFAIRIEPLHPRRGRSLHRSSPLGCRL